MKSIGIVDLNIGNIGSVERMLVSLDYNPIRCRDPDQLIDIAALIIPGVGNFDAVMTKLRDSQLDAAIKALVLAEKIPIMGICIGMHIFCTSSSEGSMAGLGLVNGHVLPIRQISGQLPSPNMGWRQIEVCGDTDLFEATSEPRFYFVHSYFVKMSDEAAVIAKTSYGEDFCAGYRVGNIYGLQFHPEKSHRYGLDVFRRFLSII